LRGPGLGSGVDTRADITERQLSYLTQLRDAMVNAHRHKETLAWAVTAFYVVGTGQVIGLVRSRTTLQVDQTRLVTHEVRTGLTLRFAVAGLFLLVTLMLSTYQRRQFNLRHYYVRMSEVVEGLVADCLAGGLDREDWSRPPVATKAIGKDSAWREAWKWIVRPPARIVRFFFPPRIAITRREEDGAVTPRMLGLFPAIVAKRACDLPHDPGLNRVYELPYYIVWLVGVSGLLGIMLLH